MARIVDKRFGWGVLLGVAGMVSGCTLQPLLSGLEIPTGSEQGPSASDGSAPGDQFPIDNDDSSAGSPAISGEGIFWTRCAPCHVLPQALAEKAGMIGPDLGEISTIMSGVTLSDREVELLRLWLGGSAGNGGGEQGPDGGNGEAGQGGGDQSPGEEPQEDPETPPAENNPPVAEHQVVGTPMNSALPITLSATDPDEDPLTYSIVNGPAHGSFSGNPPDVTYLPDENYVGFDSFSFQADDGRPGGVSNTANVRIWVIDEQDLSGQTVSGTIDPSSEIEIWGFPGVAGQRVLITVAAGPLSPIMSLYPPGS